MLTVSTFSLTVLTVRGALHGIWPSIIQDDLSVHFQDLQWLRWFYSHKSNLKTPGSAAPDELLLGLTFWVCTC